MTTPIITVRNHADATAGGFAVDAVLVNEDGTPFSGGGTGTAYTLPAATADTLGGVKQAAFGNAIGNATPNVAAAAGDTPTKAEFDAFVTAFNSLALQFNRLISGLANAGIIQLPAVKQADETPAQPVQ